MATIKAARWPGFTLPSGHKVPWDEPLVTTNDTLRMLDNARVIAGLVACGDIDVTYDPDPEPDMVVATVSISDSAAPAPETDTTVPADPIEPQTLADAPAPARKK